MWLTVVSKDSQEDVAKALGTAITRYPGVKFVVVPSLDKIPGIVTAVLALGPAVLEEFQAVGAAAKNRTITSLRCKVHQYNNLPVLFSYNIGVKAVNYGQYSELLTDAELAFRLAKTGSIDPQYGTYVVVPDLQPVVDRAKHLLESREDLDMGFDTETLGLDRFAPHGYLISMQFSFEPGHSQLVLFKSREESHQFLHNLHNQEHLSWLLNEKRIKTCAANGKYDLEWVFEHSGVECRNFTFDTTMVGSLLDENRSNGLDIHAKCYGTTLAGYSDRFDRTADKSRMDLELLKDPEEFVKYAGGDPDATLQVKQAQKQELLKDPELAGFYVHLMHPALRAFEKVERGGVLLDMDAYKSLESELKASMAKSIDAAKEVMGGLIVAKHYDPNKFGGLNLTKASLITDFMFSHRGLNLKPKMLTDKTKAPVTSLEHLLMFKDVPEASAFVEIMSEYSSASKMLSTYVEGFQKHIRSDGRFHPSYYLFAGDREEGEGGTNTGRLSARDPAFQTIPKHNKWAKAIRACYPAPPGYLVLEVDYAQGELKVIACISNEEQMIHAYLSGLDLHVVTSGGVAGYTYEEMMAMKVSNKPKYDAIRQLGKAGNFGLIFGMGVEGFIDYARTDYGVTLSYGEGLEFHSGFFNRYPGLTRYHKVYKEFARKNGYVRNPLGRVRHLPLIKSPLSQVRSKAERNAINSPVQSTLTDMMIWAIAQHVDSGGQDIAPCFGAIHDAGYYYIPEDNAELVTREIRGTMENLPFHKVGWNPQLKFTADAKVGANMGYLKEVDW